MRIISGKYKSRKIFSALPAKENCLSGNRSNLRPTTDRARESIFNILANKIDFDGIKCLDLFAGTGAFGFECISRGADLCEFAESAGKQLSMIKKTAVELGCQERVILHKQEALHFLSKKSESFYDLIFADPPYDYDKYDSLVDAVLALNFSIFVLEYSALEKINADENKYDIIDRKAGITSFRIFITK